MKVAVVTGAAGAIGGAVCTRLLARGYRVVAIDIDEVGLSRLPEAVVAIPCDLTRTATPGTVADIVAERAGRCDVLVNNAGIVVTTPFERVTAEELHREQAVNLQAPMMLTRALFPMLQQAGGQVVSVVSLGGMLPLGHSPGYSASKFGLRGFLLALAMRQAETGVAISIINPGAVDTPMLRHEAATGGSPLNFIGEPLSPEHVADTVVARIGRPRLETNLPRYDGWLVKAAMLAPGLLARTVPLLERLARPNMSRYRQKYGL